MSASSRMPPSEMRWYLRPVARAIDRAIEVLPTPGGPTKRRIGPRRGFGVVASALPSLSVALLAAPSLPSPSAAAAGRRGFALELELAHRQELEHPVLDVLEPVVVLLEDLRRVLEVDLLLGAGVPRQLGDGLEVGADHLRLHRLAAHARQSSELAVDLLAHVLRQLESVELGPQLVELGAAFTLAQLVLDRLHLLAQEHLALAIADLGLDLVLDRLLGVEHVELTLHVGQHQAQPLLDRERLEQLLALLRREVEVAGDQIGEATGLGDALEHLLDRVLGQPRALAELRRALAQLTMERHERGFVGRLGRQLLGLDHGGHDHATRFVEAHRVAAPQSGDEELGSGQAALLLVDARDGAGGEQRGGVDLLGVAALQGGEDQLVRRVVGGFDGAQTRRTARQDRHGDAGEDHHVAQGQDREMQGLFAQGLGCRLGHRVPVMRRHGTPGREGRGASASVSMLMERRFGLSYSSFSQDLSVPASDHIFEACTQGWADPTLECSPRVSEWGRGRSGPASSPCSRRRAGR